MLPEKYPPSPESCGRPVDFSRLSPDQGRQPVWSQMGVSEWGSPIAGWFTMEKILYFVWSPPWHLYILLLANLLAFYLTFYLAFYLAYLLAFYLSYVRAYLLAFYLAYLIAFYLAYLLAFYLAVEVQRCTLSWAGPRLRSSGAHWAGKLAKSLAKSWQGGSWGGSWCRHGRGETGGGGRGGGGRGGGGRGRGGQLAEENNSDKI